MPSELIIYDSPLPVPSSMERSQSRSLVPRQFLALSSYGLGSPLIGSYYAGEWFRHYSGSAVNEEFNEFVRYLAAMNAFYQQAAFATGRAQARRYWRTHIAPQQVARRWRLRWQHALLAACLIGLVLVPTHS